MQVRLADRQKLPQRISVEEITSMPLIRSDVTSRPSRWRARQPFVGLVIAAVLGVVIGDYFAIAARAWLPVTGVFALAAIAMYRWPHVTSTYALAGFGFFLLHTFHTQDTPGQRLVERLGDRARVMTAIGTVTSEPKVAPNGFATFLITLKSVELEDTIVRSDASCLVRWRGTPELGDELRLFGIAELIAPPRKRRRPAAAWRRESRIGCRAKNSCVDPTGFVPRFGGRA